MTTPLRPPFVWTPKQEIDPGGGRRVYLGAGGRPFEKNRWFLFRKRVELPARPASAPLSITVDGRYVLFVNGKQIGRGPVRCSPLFQRYDDYDLAPHLRAGANVIAVLVHTYGTDTAFYETVKGMWQPMFGDGGLWVQCAAAGVWRVPDSAMNRR
jgi:alpha-L-rhamnosidase